MDLTSTQKTVILYIKEYIKQYNKPIPKYVLEDKLSLDRNQLNNCLKQLVDKGYLRKGITSMRTYVLRINI